MTERDDILVTSEFAAFRAAYSPAVRPAGPAAVRETIRQRRRRTAVVTAAAVVLAVAIPVGANAALQRRTGRPPAPAQSIEPTPSQTLPSSTPTTASPTPSTADPTPATPSGRISRTQLLAARLDLPDWPWYVPKTCTTAKVRLDPGPGVIGDSVPVLLGDPDYGDLDGDGGAETVALVSCRNGEAQVKQVVAFDRDVGGRIRPMGQIVGTFDELPDITEFSVRADGRIRVRVADGQACCGTPGWMPQRQWRTYAWSGGRFRQVEGPTSFGPNPHVVDLAITADDITWGPKGADGTRTGTAVVIVRNLSQVPASLVEVHLRMQVGTTADGGDWAACQGGPPPKGPIICRFGPLGPGATRTFRFGLRNSNTSSGTGIAEVDPIGTEAFPLSDPSRENNEDRYRYR
ncbi:hypothetical protein ABZ570_14905 [Micromonospora sp. NPDC007271]|uniref:hypothetical protein n=1 Tax=Micromonospora sp. NPDC007271 TaxID=3154587 RepID=UPI0033FFEEF9